MHRRINSDLIIYNYTKFQEGWFVTLHHTTPLTLYHMIPTFNDPEEESFVKHCGKRRKCWYLFFSIIEQKTWWEREKMVSKKLGEKEKMLVTSNLSLFHSVFCAMIEKNRHFNNEFVFCKCFHVQNFVIC